MGRKIVSFHLVTVLILLFTMVALCSRPKCVNEVAQQEEVVAVLKKSIEGAEVKLPSGHHDNLDD